MQFISKARGLCPLEPPAKARLCNPIIGFGMMAAPGSCKASGGHHSEALRVPRARPWRGSSRACVLRTTGQSPLALLTNRRERRASVSVEFALVAVMVLLPLFAGGADFMELISAQSQLDASLQSLYAFAWNSPGSATNMSQVNGILAVVNAHSLPQVSLGAAPSLSYQTASSGQQTFVTYKLAATVNLAVPVPYVLGSSFALAASGTVQIQ